MGEAEIIGKYGSTMAAHGRRPACGAFGELRVHGMGRRPARLVRGGHRVVGRVVVHAATVPNGCRRDAPRRGVCSGTDPVARGAVVAAVASRAL